MELKEELENAVVAVSEMKQNVEMISTLLTPENIEHAKEFLRSLSMSLQETESGLRGLVVNHERVTAT